MMRWSVGAGVATIGLVPLLGGATHAAAVLPCDLSGFAATPGITASATPDGVVLLWSGDREEELRLALGVRDGAPLVRDLSLRRPGGNWVSVAEDAGIEYRVVEGLRRMSNQQMVPLRELGVELTQEVVDRYRWDAFHDAPLDLRTEGLGGGNPPPVAGVPGTDQPPLPRSPEEVRRAEIRFAAEGCRVEGTGARARVTFPGVTLGSFSGDLVVTAFAGTNLIETAVVASTDRPAVAYKYDAGLTGLRHGPESHVFYRDTTNRDRTFGMRGPANDEYVVIPAANRLIVGTIGAASIAAFPPPHTFFWARQIHANVGYNWYRKDDASSFSIGIRQGESEVADNWLGNWALYSAPPGSVQRMKAYFLPALGDHHVAADAALAFTNGDVYPKPPGYEVMGAHYHINVAQRVDAAGGNLDLHIPDFDVLRSAGITIAGPAERPAAARQPQLLRLAFDWAERHSDESFLVYPQKENSNRLGGHWDLLFSRPVLYEDLPGPRGEDEPLVRTDPDLGSVWSIGSVDDFLTMFEAEDMLVYMPHPRTKGSTGYPDAIAESPQFLHDRYRGVGWRWGMGSDLSETRLSEFRVLPLLDEMNNWITGTGLRPKTLMAITETYYSEPGYDVYSGGPVTYLRLPEGLPAPGHYAPIVRALDEGDYFLSSGEVLIPEHSYTGAGSEMRLTAEVHWSFPLDLVEIVTGDGETTTTLEVPAEELGAFGRHTFEIPFDGTGRAWVRFAAWDVAGNGAMTNPVWIRP